MANSISARKELPLIIRDNPISNPDNLLQNALEEVNAMRALMEEAARPEDRVRYEELADRAQLRFTKKIDGTYNPLLEREQERLDAEAMQQLKLKLEDQQVEMGRETMAKDVATSQEAARQEEFDRTMQDLARTMHERVMLQNMKLPARDDLPEMFNQTKNMSDLKLKETPDPVLTQTKEAAPATPLILRSETKPEKLDAGSATPMVDDMIKKALAPLFQKDADEVVVQQRVPLKPVEPVDKKKAGVAKITGL